MATHAGRGGENGRTNWSSGSDAARALAESAERGRMSSGNQAIARDLSYAKFANDPGHKLVRPLRRSERELYGDWSGFRVSPIYRIPASFRTVISKLLVILAWSMYTASE